MRVLKWRRTAATLSSAVLLATGVLMAPAVATDTAPVAKGCYTRDGFPPQKSGNNIGGTPNRYEYNNSPYIGGRYESCGNVIKLYYGGYTTNLTHYRVRWQHDNDSWQVSRQSPGERRVWTLDAPGNDYNFMVQACNGNSCTSWSPQLYVNAR